MDTDVSRGCEPSSRCSRLHLMLPHGASLGRIPAELGDLLEILLQVREAVDWSRAQGYTSANVHQLIVVRKRSFWSDKRIKEQLMYLLRCGFGIPLDIRLRTSDEPPLVTFSTPAPSPAAPRAAAQTAMTSSPVASPSSAAQPRVYAFTPTLDSVAGLHHRAKEDSAPMVLVACSSDWQKSTWPHAAQRLAERLALGVPVQVARCTATPHAAGAEHGPTHAWRLIHLVATAAVALAMGASEAEYFENGVSCMGLPAALASHRTPPGGCLHPEVLAAISQLLAAMTGEPFTFRNPFADMLPEEALSGLRGPADDGGRLGFEVLRDLLDSHGTWEQRIDQYISLLGTLPGRSGVADQCWEVLLPELLTPMNDNTATAYIRSLRDLAALPDDELTMRLGEAPQGRSKRGRELALLLSRRHADRVRATLAALLRHCVEGLVAGTLAPTCFIARVAASDTTGAVREPTFRRCAERWEIWYHDGAPMYLHPSKGLAYIHALIAHPGKVYSATELRARVDGMDVETGISQMELADGDAIAAYKERLDELRAELHRAAAMNDLGRSERVQEEIEAVTQELRRCLGMGGRMREQSSAERARKSVSNAIHRALERIRAAHPLLAEHLQATLSIGSYLCYAPSNINWRT